MSDYVVPLTSPVQLTNLNDIHAVDLHVRYCELVKAYEQLVFPRPSHGALLHGTGRAAEAMDDNATDPQPPGPVCQLLRACGGALTPCRLRAQVRDRNEDKKDYEHKIRAMRTVMSKETVALCVRSGVCACCGLSREAAQTLGRKHSPPPLTPVAGQVWRKREIEPKLEASSVPGSDVELRFAQLQKRLQLMEASLEDERKVNKELEADLQTAVKEGIKYRDHLALMLDIREKDTRAQENIRSRHEQDEARQNATLEASLKEAEKSVEFERAEAQRLQKELDVLEAFVGANREENSSLSAQVLPAPRGPALSLRDLNEPWTDCFTPAGQDT
jgi:hypothetical protein